MIEPLSSALQIETTTRCTLKCPACSRTIFSEKLKKPYPHYDVDVDDLYNFLNCASGKQIEQLVLCGDYGDSIYYPRLFEFLEKFKPDKSIWLITNGSYQNQQFWNNLCARLDKSDTVVFSIDGLEDTNHLYRVNSDWNSIMAAVDTVAKSGINVVWETNVFSFNYTQLEKIKQFAESKGAKFSLKKTSRFGRDDLIPPVEFINTTETYNSQYSDSSSAVKIDPDCKNIYRNTVCARNYFWPCGYIRSPMTFYKSKLYKDRDLWSIKNTTLDELIQGPLANWIQGIEENPGGCDVICKMKCKQNQSQIERVAL
jgi:MoaA/NifB/PqqE/SkfB family radical SAM enzyme